jgi:hypothetical protein
MPRNYLENFLVNEKNGNGNLLYWLGPNDNEEMKLAMDTCELVASQENVEEMDIG